MHHKSEECRANKGWIELADGEICLQQPIRCIQEKTIPIRQDTTPVQHLELLPVPLLMTEILTGDDAKAIASLFINIKDTYPHNKLTKRALMRGLCNNPGFY